MMALRRKRGQAIRIGNNIRLIILDVQHGNNVRLGVEAPENVPVHRLEIFETIQAENRAASEGNIHAWIQGREDA